MEKKKVVLLGDSIRLIGYGLHVPEMLGDEYEVWQPEDNCRFTFYTLRMLHDFKDSIKGADVSHWNNGLWDALHLLGDEAFTDLDYYGKTLLRIYKRIRLVFPKAQIVFALSTTVKEAWADPNFIRYNHEIELYNQKAIEVLSPLGVRINDLYSVTRDFADELRSDWVHFGEAGSRILADAVISKCEEML